MPAVFSNEVARLNSLALLLLVVGLFQIVGYTFHLPQLAVLGLATAASPLPLPFSPDASGFENIATHYEYELQYADGSTIPANLSNVVEHYDFGPHRRKISYLQASLYLPMFDVPIVRSVLTRLYCRTTFFDTVGKKSPAPLERILLHMHNEVTPVDTTITLTCTP